MKLIVEFFAGLRERAACTELTLEGLEEPLDVDALKGELERRMPELGSLSHVTGVIGTEYVAGDYSLSDGERVALLPPVSGGEVADADLLDGVFVLTSAPLDVEAARGLVEHANCGAVVVFAGNVRDQNRGEEVVRLEYEALERMAGPEMGRIFESVRAEFGDADGGAPERALRMYCAHRTGAVEVGEPSVVIAVASPHRSAAFDAARALIDRLKERLPVWKKELYSDGHQWIGERS